ncbi:nucleoside/nucleotide kinase family protein [Acidimangrovimonas sediminis]|uniref:uridine kinase n=1 Tax=Acidimangrovimonas sediminis TaxID=2056283 RepID=UPI001E3DC757|nr:uridine kinase [Acidimangrovimonas sediminis]
MAQIETHVQAVLALIGRTVPKTGRVVIAVAGPPGSGKSTLAARVVGALNPAGGAPQAALVPMDGFHLDNEVLDARGLRAVKGAPQTFDASGLADLLARLRRPGTETRFPEFDRAADRVVPGAGHLPAETATVVVEGNYLLLAEAPWSALAPFFDATVILAPPLPEIRSRLVARWQGLGLDAAEIAARVDGNDMVNARTVLDRSVAADLVLG